MAICLFCAWSFGCLSTASADEGDRFEPSTRGNRVGSPERAVSGRATWYGSDFHGLLMADGTPYDMWDPTIAASNIYPLGTSLRVTRVATGDSLIVQVRDRGAFRDPIVVDLSYAAFTTLADESDGVIRVTVEPID